MVLPSPAALDREGSGDADWLERITRVFRRTARGVLVLCDRASPGRLRDLVVGLCQAGLPPEIVAEPTELVDLPIGAVVVLAVQAQHATWLNLSRPILNERALRLVLFSQEEATAALRMDAPDLFDWISHSVACPPLPAAPHAVLGLRAALRARVEGVEWRGDDLAATFAAALPGRPLLQKSAALPEDEMTSALRSAKRGWIAWSDVDNYAALGRLRQAQVAARRRTRLILLHPQMVVPDFWPLHDRFAVLGEACAVLRVAGATSPGRLAALAGMEPEAIELLEERMRAGCAQEDLERGLVEQKDPGAWLAAGAARSFEPRPPEWRAGQRAEPSPWSMFLLTNENSSRTVDAPMLTEKMRSIFERTLSARRDGDDLAPRRRGDQSVSLAASIATEWESLGRSEAPRAGTVERAPAPSPHFRGRDDEIARGIAFLKVGRLVSVTGTPGMGKSEVALAVARQVVRDPELRIERAIWFSLDGVTQAEALRAMIAVAFGAEPARCPDDSALARQIGAMRALLVLDNAEDVIQGDLGEMRGLVGTLLRECSGLKVLLATRVPLGDLRAAAEREIRIGSLRESDAREVFLSVAGPRLTVDERDSEDLDAIITWLDGHPLSLTLIARQVGTMSLGQLRRRLETKEVDAAAESALLGEEPPPDKDAKLRLGRLASSLNLSFQPLSERSPGAAEMFAWLGHFPAGLPSVLVPYVFGEEGDDHRAELLRMYLLEEVGWERRLTLSAPVRSYARERAREIPASRRLELVTASFEVLAQWFEALRSEVGHPGSRDAVDQGAREEANLAALLRALSEAGDTPSENEAAITLAAWMAATVDHFTAIMLFAGRASAAIAVAQHALARIDALTGVAGRPMARTLEALGALYVRTERLKEAEETYAQALPLYKAINERIGEANTHQALGELYVHTDRLKEAEEAHAQALLLYKAIDERLGEANTQKALGDLYVRTARLKEAEEAYAQALRLYKAIDERLGEAATRQALGDLYVRTDRLKEAKEAYAQALRFYKAIDARLGEATTQRALGDLYVRTDRLKEAEEAYAQALLLFKAIDDRLGEANTHQALGELYVRTARLKEAEEAYAQALLLFKAIDARLGEANTHQALGELYVRTDRLKEAEEAYAQALRLFKAIDERLGESNTHQALGDLYVRTARLKEAEEAYAQALRLYKAIDARLGEANTMTGLGSLALAHRDFIGAFNRYCEALRLHRAIDNDLGVAAGHLYLARAAIAADRPLRAVVLLRRAIEFFVSLDDHFDLVLAYSALAHALHALGREEAANAVLIAAWAHAIAIEHPIAQQIAQATDSAAPPSPEDLAECNETLTAALAECEEELARLGEDPYSPLPSIG